MAPRPGTSHAKGTISASPTMKPSGKKSPDVYNEAGTGSRPAKSKFPIQSSAPTNPHMIRPAPSPLK